VLEGAAGSNPSEQHARRCQRQFVGTAEHVAEPEPRSAVGGREVHDQQIERCDARTADRPRQAIPQEVGAGIGDRRGHY